MKACSDGMRNPADAAALPHGMAANAAIRRMPRSGPGRFVALFAAAHGIFLIASTLFGQFAAARGSHRRPDADALIDISLLSGLALVYLSLLLRRLKHNAWFCAAGLYVFLLGFNIDAAVDELHTGGMRHALIVVLSALMLILLWASRRDFVVRSDMRTFAGSLKVASLLLLTAFAYGTVGFVLMDHEDFRRPLSLLAAMHYTVDQFALTTVPLQAHTRRAELFQGSLATISTAAVGFALISLFQPLRARFTHQKERYRWAGQLVADHAADRPGISEDCYKLLPHDKDYFFSYDQRAALAYRVHGGVALVLGDPFGAAASAGQLLDAFEELCFVNDWQPAFMQVTGRWRAVFAARGYRVQAIGQAAIVDLEQAAGLFAARREFRRIASRFARLGYRTEWCVPPHSPALLGRLQQISAAWLARLGRSERGFNIGYFSEAYLQQMPLFIARDAEGTIQAFLNAPLSPAPQEAMIDLLRCADGVPFGCSDYLLICYAAHLRGQGCRRLNLGMCALHGMEHQADTPLNRLLQFIYSNGGRFYAFQGLYRFKAKYRPEWHDRFMVYCGGMHDFARVLRALRRTGRV